MRHSSPLRTTTAKSTASIEHGGGQSGGGSVQHPDRDGAVELHDGVGPQRSEDPVEAEDRKSISAPASVAFCPSWASAAISSPGGGPSGVAVAVSSVMWRIGYVLSILMVVGESQRLGRCCESSAAVRVTRPCLVSGFFACSIHDTYACWRLLSSRGSAPPTRAAPAFLAERASRRGWRPTWLARISGLGAAS
jgi:hypothetical protein